MLLCPAVVSQKENEWKGENSLAFRISLCVEQKPHKGHCSRLAFVGFTFTLTLYQHQVNCTGQAWKKSVCNWHRVANSKWPGWVVLLFIHATCGLWATVGGNPKSVEGESHYCCSLTQRTSIFCFQLLPWQTQWTQSICWLIYHKALV